MARSDRYTETSVQPIYHRDFATSFARNPVTGNLATTTNAESAKVMIRNLILTRLGSRFYQPNLGTNFVDIEFGLADQITRDLTESSIRQSIQNELPFVELIGVEVKDLGLRRVIGNTGKSDPNSYSVTIVFGLRNDPGPHTLSVPLTKRAR